MAAGGTQRRKPDWPLNSWAVKCIFSTVVFTYAGTIFSRTAIQEVL